MNDVEVFPTTQQIVRCEYCFNRYKCKQAHHAVRWCTDYVGPWNIKSLKKRKK